MNKVFLLLFLPITLFAQTQESEKLDNYLKAQESVKGFSGAVLVMKQNKVVLRKGYGMADMEWNIPNTADTRFRVGSVTKQFTAACILQLEEEGRLSVTDKLSKYFPGYPKGDSITIHMLLNHTSGIANYTNIPEFMKVARLNLSKDSMVNFFKNRPFGFSPGTKFSYSNSGYFLLGIIIEKVSGLSYNAYLRQHIFNKLEMNESGVDRLDTILSKRAKGYSKAGKKFVNAEYISMDWPFSAGVIYSTLDDMYKWDRALYNNSVLSESSRKKMFTPGLSNYGYGVNIDSLDGHPRIWHNGGIPGFLTNFSRFVKDDLCIVVFSNNETSADFLSLAISNIMFGEEVEAPYFHKEVKIDPALLDKFVGKYSAGLIIEVIKKDNKLYRHRNGSPDIELKPESPTKFFYDDETDRVLEFELDKDGKVAKIWFHNSGQKGELKKVQ